MTRNMFVVLYVVLMIAIVVGAVTDCSFGIYSGNGWQRTSALSWCS